MAEQLFEELRGVPYRLATNEALLADRRAAHQLLGAADGDLEEVAIRWRAALVNEGFPRIDTLVDLARHWPRFSPGPGDARRRRLAAAASAEPKRREVVKDADSTCPQWDALAARLRSRLRPELYERWFARLRAKADGKGLVLLAPDPYAAAFLQDNYAPWLSEEAKRAKLPGVVRIVAGERARAV